ncbi:MAG: hypothetical protein KIT22_13960, partial [Verrucomicrobiae bacterium]|nr:hypothetical protein [Verrucomicrobiae bacterium]
MFINDANEILFGHLFLTPSCPSASFSAAGTAGFEFIDGKVSVRLGNRFTIRTTIRNTGRGVLENIRIEAPEVLRFFRRVGLPSPPIPDRLSPGESVISLAEWEAIETGDYQGTTTLHADGPCGPVIEPLPPARIAVVDPLPVIAVTAPAGNEIVPRGTSYTVRFTAPPAVKAVDLYLVSTRNPDGPRTLLAKGVPADAGQYVWKVPEEMETPSTFLIAVDADDPAREGNSRRFRVREPWRLHRVVGTPNEPKYERITSTFHAWSFEQKAENLWPVSYWARPSNDYPNLTAGFDPFTGPEIRYNFGFFGGRFEGDYPPWSAVVRGFGIPVAYVSLEPWSFGGTLFNQPNPAAASWWTWELLANDPEYGGACYGLSMGMMAAFQDPDRFDARWLPGGGSAAIGELPVSDSIRDAAHALQIYEDALGDRELGRAWNPRDIPAFLKDMFEKDERDEDRFLIIESDLDYLDENGEQAHGAHAVVPVRMKLGEDGVYVITVFDPNEGNGPAGIFLDPAANEWWHSNPVWLGDVGQGLSLSPPVSDAFAPAYFDWASFPESDSQTAASPLRRSPEMERPVLPIQIIGRAGAVTSDAGELRFEGGQLTRTLPGGSLRFPITGRASQPRVYLVPAGGLYRAEAVPRSNGMAGVRVRDGAVTTSLLQTAAVSPTRMVTRLLNQGLGVVSGGEGRFEFTAQVAVGIGDVRGIRVMGLATTNPAGLRLTTDANGFHLGGAGSATTYHLELIRSAADGSRILHHADVPLAAGAGHTI